MGPLPVRDHFPLPQGKARLVSAGMEAISFLCRRRGPREPGGRGGQALLNRPVLYTLAEPWGHHRARPHGSPARTRPRNQPPNQGAVYPAPGEPSWSPQKWSVTASDPFNSALLSLQADPEQAGEHRAWPARPFVGQLVFRLTEVLRAPRPPTHFTDGQPEV